MNAAFYPSAVISGALHCSNTEVFHYARSCMATYQDAYFTISMGRECCFHSPNEELRD